MIDVRTYHVSFFYVIYRSLLKMMRKSSMVEMRQLNQQVNWNSFFHQREASLQDLYDWIDYNPTCSTFALLFAVFEIHHYASYCSNATATVNVSCDCQSIFKGRIVWCHYLAGNDAQLQQSRIHAILKGIIICRLDWYGIFRNLSKITMIPI